MLSSETSQKLYQARLARWTRQFSHGLSDLRPGELAAGSSLSEVRLFVEENVQKRHDKVSAFCSLLTETCPELDHHIDDYVRHVETEPCDAARSDAFRFLCWLESHCLLSPEQRDCLVCDRSRIEVEQRARQDRLAYVRFAELRSVVEHQIDGLDRDDRHRLLLDPTRVRALLQTPLFVGAVPVPASVLFHAVDGELRTCLLDESSLEVLDQLEEYPAATFGRLAASLPSIPREELLEQCRELAQHGLLVVA